MQHRSAANFRSLSNDRDGSLEPIPYLLNQPAVGQRAAESTTDYFSTAWQEAAELRPAMLVRRQRDSVRPIPLRFTQPRFGNLVPTEHWFGRLVAGVLAVAITLGGAASILLFGLLNPSPLHLSSPTLQRLVLHASGFSLRAFNHWPPSLTQIPLPLSSVEFCIELFTTSIVLFIIARRISGVFGGLVVLLLLMTSVASQHQLDLAEPIALAGIAFLIGGWRSDGVGRSVVGSLLLGLAASIAHAQLLLLPLLLLAALDLPWRWSWLLPLIWLSPVALLSYCDARMFEVHFVVIDLKLFAATNAHQRLGDALTLVLSRNNPEWFLAPLAVAGVGLIARIEWRWAILLIGMLLPAAGQYWLHGAAALNVTMLLLPTLLLAGTWSTVRSAWASGLIAAVVSGLSLWIAVGNG